MIPGRIQVRDLLRGRGGTAREQGTLRPGRVGLSTARLTGEDAHYDLTLEAEGGRIHLTGTVRAAWEGECRRCLGPVEDELEITVAETFEANPVEGETWPIDDGEIDLTVPLTQALVLGLPIAPLCDPDCEGPDPERYPTAPETDDEDEPGPVTDPRWAALEGLQLDDQPESGDDDR